MIEKLAKVCRTKLKALVRCRFKNWVKAVQMEK